MTDLQILLEKLDTLVKDPSFIGMYKPTLSENIYEKEVKDHFREKNIIVIPCSEKEFIDEKTIMFKPELYTTEGALTWSFN